ncbi:DUF1285 domain-containing protein, partial [bacterium]|nr:DUF1285 domain-containing protein [bacterium]
MPDRLQSDGDAGKFIRESSSSSTRFPPIRIGSDGKWYLGDSAFNKPAMVKLLVSRLRRQGNKYYLQEDRWRLPIVVDDLPLQIVALARQPDNSVQLHTSEGECLSVGAAHRLALSRLATTAHV